MATNEITKHIENTNANYRDVSMGDAKNTDLFLNQEHFNLFKNAGKTPETKLLYEFIRIIYPKPFCS